MIFNKGVIDPNRTARPSDLISGPYPIGLSLDKFLDLFADVKSLDGDGLALIDNTLSNNIAATDIIGSLININQFGANDSVSSFAGSSERKVVPIGQLNLDGTPFAESRRPSTLCDYPTHLIGSGGGGTIAIDFGRTLIYAGLYYPYILVQFSNGMSNIAGGTIVGDITFDGYGSIPVYGGPELGALSVGLVVGSLKVSERFSSLRTDSLTVAPNSSITFSTKGPFSKLSKYKRAFFGSAQVSTSTSANSITMTVPINATSGPVRFESDGPLYDTFLSYDSITIASAS